MKLINYVKEVLLLAFEYFKPKYKRSFISAKSIAHYTSLCEVVGSAEGF